jgi:hypothetical protein
MFDCRLLWQATSDKTWLLKENAMKNVLCVLPILVMGFAVQANETGHSNKSKYAGQEQRAIKSLSPDDLVELRRGGGWGLARAAELNGVPGPSHLLELKDKIPLNAIQVKQIRALFESMKIKAVAHGKTLIGLERQLEKHFKDRTINDAILRASLEAIAQTRKNLRYVHLATHLKTPEILSEAQIGKYNDLRGYASSDPCANVPEGHDKKMWRKHNGCS